MKAKTKKRVRSAAYRALRTFLQSFLAIVTAGPLLDVDVSTLKVAALSGVAAVLALLQRWLDSTGVPTIPAD